MSSLTSMAQSVGALLKERGETIAIAESSTGGLISAALLAVPGASAQTARGALLDIDLESHPRMRPSSEPYAQLLANTGREQSRCYLDHKELYRLVESRNVKSCHAE